MENTKKENAPNILLSILTGLITIWMFPVLFGFIFWGTILWIPIKIGLRVIKNITKNV